MRREQILPGRRALQRLRERVRRQLTGDGLSTAAFRRSVASSVGQMLR